MFIDKLLYPAAYYNETICLYKRSRSHSDSYFGGPSSYKMTGLAHGPRALHHMMTLHWQHLPGKDFDLNKLPLFYGMCYDGCELKYDFGDSHECRLLEMNGNESHSCWPYAGYPDLLPFTPLKRAYTGYCEAERFCEAIDLQSDPEPDELMIVIPPIFDLGMSLWGPAGDAEGVKIVFRFNVKTRVVSVGNECG